MGLDMYIYKKRYLHNTNDIELKINNKIVLFILWTFFGLFYQTVARYIIKNITIRIIVTTQHP